MKSVRSSPHSSARPASEPASIIDKGCKSRRQLFGDHVSATNFPKTSKGRRTLLADEHSQLHQCFIRPGRFSRKRIRGETTRAQPTACLVSARIQKISTYLGGVTSTCVLRDAHGNTRMTTIFTLVLRRTAPQFLFSSLQVT